MRGFHGSIKVCIVYVRNTKD